MVFHDLEFNEGWDGIHIRGGKNITIRNCRFFTGDDAIAGGYWENMVISDCHINSSCNGVRMIMPATGLTISNYMAERFGFNAMEMTSSEIIDKLQDISDKESIKDLMFLFQTADLVKFAKHSPLMNENDMNLVNAVEFINNTKVEADPNAKPEPTEITVEEKRSKQGRIILLGSIGVIVIAIAVILYQVLRGIYNLWF